jgi:hypothetical protein
MSQRFATTIENPNLGGMQARSPKLSDLSNACAHPFARRYSASATAPLLHDAFVCERGAPLLTPCSLRAVRLGTCRVVRERGAPLLTP